MDEVVKQILLRFQGETLFLRVLVVERIFGDLQVWKVTMEPEELG